MREYEAKTNRELFRITRGQLIGKYGVAILANLLIGLISLIVLNLTSNVSEVVNLATYLLDIGITLIIDVLMGVLIFGRNAFFLKLARGENNLKVADVFVGFKKSTDKAILIQTVFVAISLIGYIPSALIKTGIITISDSSVVTFSIFLVSLQILLSVVANLFLVFSFYILVDHPDYTVSEILTESVNLTKNKKGRLILIYLSLIPLEILGLLSCGIGALYVQAFSETLFANFYLDSIKEDSYRPFDKAKEQQPVSDSDSTTSDIH